MCEVRSSDSWKGQSRKEEDRRDIRLPLARSPNRTAYVEIMSNYKENYTKI